MGSPMIISREEKNPAGINANPSRPRRPYSSRAGHPFIPGGLSFYSRRPVVLFPRGLCSSPGHAAPTWKPGPTGAELSGHSGRRGQAAPCPPAVDIPGQSQRRRSIACRADTGAQV